MKREEAIDRIKWAKQRLDRVTYSPETQEALDMAIEALKEQRPHGEWIDSEDNNYCKCSICGNIVMIEEVTTYCGSCGASMVKEGEAE